MAAWVPFGVLTLALIGVLLLLSIVSARAVGGTDTVADRSTGLEGAGRRARTRGSHRPPNDPRLPRFERPEADRPTDERAVERRSAADRDDEGPPAMSTGALLANVALTQGLFGAAVLAAALYFAIPLSSLGVETPVAADEILVGIGVGLLLWLGNEVAAGLADAAGVGYDESVRSMLTPDSALGWLVLLGAILPTIAVVEELLFRGAAIGALSTGFGIPESLLVVASSVAFGGAHGAQGRIGAAVATALGLALAIAFVLTGSLLVVIVAHYLVNGLEFVVHEGFDVDRPLAMGDRLGDDE